MIRMIRVCTFSQIENDIIFIFSESADTDHPNHLLDDISNLKAYLKSESRDHSTYLMNNLN